MIWYILLALVLWTIASIWHFFWSWNKYGKTGHEPDPWYIWVFGAPVLGIACIAGFLLNKKNRKKTL
jgi:hypothetical protein